MIWLLLCIPAAIAELIALVAAPFLPFFADAWGFLPIWLSWFETPDNTAWGDKGHQERHKNSSMYWQQLCWFARNRAYGFKLYVLGCPFTRDRIVYGNPHIKNRNNAVAGWMILIDDNEFWYAKAVVPVGFNYCIQLAFGWQLDAVMVGRCLWMFSPRVTKFYPKEA